MKGFLTDPEAGTILSNYFLPLIIFLIICILAASNFSTASKIEKQDYKRSAKIAKKQQRAIPAKKTYKPKRSKPSLIKYRKRKAKEKNSL